MDAYLSARRAPSRGRATPPRRNALPALAALLAFFAPAASHAGPGSGSATLLQPGVAVAGSRNGWTIGYTASENFDNGTGGTLDFVIPAGWSPPQNTSPGSPGYVDYTNPSAVLSITITGQTIRLVLHGPQFISGESISILYGVGGANALPFTQTGAPATARFLVLSDPNRSDAVPPDTLASGSPAVAVIPDAVTSVKIVGPTQTPVGPLIRTADQDTTHLYLRGYDQFGNSVRWVNGNWSVTGGIGSVAPASGFGTVLSIAQVGTGYVVADSGAWRDSTGLVTATQGAYASIAMASSPSAVAGAPFAASVEARDADGNRITSGPGSSRVVRFIGYADSVGGLEADPMWVTGNATLTAGAWFGNLVARRAGTFFLEARDSVAGFVSSPRLRLTVGPGAPDHMTFQPDTLDLVAGVADTATVLVRDAFGNRAPVGVAEDLTLWTDRPNGRFESLGGVEIFGVTIPAGRDSVAFRYVDTQTTVTAGLVRAIDANGAMPFLGTAQGRVATRPNAPAGAIALIASPDTLVADGVDSARVASAVIHDAYGNAVPPGERFSVSATGLTIVTDDDPSASGAQWTAANDGTIAGWVRAGSVTMGATVAIASERGSASGSVGIVLRAVDAAAVVIDPLAADTLAAGDSLLARAVVRDANGNVVPGASVTATVLSGGASVSPAAATTDGSGAATFALRAGTSLGSSLIAIASGSAADSVAITTVAAPAASVAIVPSAGSFEAGTSLDVTLTLRDPFGNVAAGATSTVWLRSSSSAPDSISWSIGTAAGTLADSASGDGASYTFTAADAGVATLLVRATRAETIRLRASGPGLPLAESADVAVTPGAAASIAVLSGDGQTGVVDHDLALPLRVRVRDAFGNLAPGDSVGFGVDLGNGFVDVVAGGAVQTVAVSDAAGVAVCDVAHLGTTAGTASDRFRAGLVALPAVELLFTASAQPDLASTLAIAPGSLSLAAGAADTVTVTARDAHGNAAPGTNVTIYLGSAAAGSLSSLGGTSGSATTQAGTTDSAGQVALRYQAPGAPGTYDLFARGVTIPPVSIPVTVGSASIASLAILPVSGAWTAGLPESVVVEARDSFGNVVLGAVESIVMGATDPASFTPASGPLVQGRFQTTVVATLADTLRLTATTGAGAVAAVSGPITVVPGAPAGTIPIVADRDTLTADGRSSTAIAFGPVRDAHGNLVPIGTQLQVGVSSGTLAGADASPAPGLQVAIGADTFARALLTAPALPGLATLTAASVAGSARDSIAIAYVPPPSLAYVAGSLAPTFVAPGQSAAFRLAVTNTAASGVVVIEPGSSFAFGAGPSAFTASPSAALTLAPGQTDTLRLAVATVSASIAPGSYAPSLRASGHDGTSEPFDFYLALSGAQVHVAGVDVTPVAASPDPVPLGYSSLALTFQVRNLTSADGTLTGVSLATTTGAFTVVNVSPAMPVALPASGSVSITVTVSTPASGIPSGTVVGAQLTASAAFGPTTFSSVNTAPLTFEVISAAQLTAQAAGTTPTRYLRGRTFAPTARVANGGSATVTLNQGATRLVLTGGATLQVGLAANAVVPGGGVADLAFDSLAVPPGAPLGSYAATLVLSGSESGQAFADTIPLAPATAELLDPAILAVQGAPAPSHVSAGQTRIIQVTVANTGGVPFALDATTRLVLAAPLLTSLTPSVVDTIPAGGALTLAFNAAAIGSAGAPGTAAATLEARGAEDGRFRAEALAAGSITADAPAQLAFVAGSTMPDTARAGSTMALTLTVRNAAAAGASPFVVEPATTRLRISDGVESAVAYASGAPFTLAPGASGTLSFPSVAFPAALASQPYPVALVVNGSEWGQAESVSVVSPAGEIHIVEPVPALQVRGLDPGAPKQASPGAAFPFWELELQPLIPPGGASSSHLFSLSLTLLADGAPAANPSALLAQVTLRDAQGAVLAQAAPGASNPMVLALSAPLPLTGPAAPIRIEAMLQPGAAVGAATIALQLANAADLDARDDLTQAAVPVRAAGGLPFQPLTSPTVTLFAKPHGYPNPFRAGREDVLLSYRLAGDASVRIAIFTLLGDRVRELSLPAGTPGGVQGLNEVAWDGRNGKGDLVRPGVYVARVEGGGVSEQIKVGVLR